jgi:nucleoside-diphosphate-sugar epimerase
VTGADGFIGLHLLERLLNEKADVTVFLRKYPWGDMKNISSLSNPIQIRYGNLRDLASLIDAMRDVEIVFHLGAQTHVPDSVADPYETFMVNGLGTLNCLEAAIRNDVDLFINTGTAKICGDPLYLPLDEKHPNRPRAPYDASKIAAEAMCMAYFKTYGLKVVMPRLTNTYGPRLDRRKVVSDFINHLLQGKPPIIRSDGTPTRDYIYIDDVIDAYIDMVRVQAAVGNIFLICTGVETSVLELCNLLIKVSQKELEPVVLGKTLQGELIFEYGDNSKAKKILKWSPKVDLKTGLTLTWKWFKNNSKYLKGA